MSLAPKYVRLAEASVSFDVPTLAVIDDVLLANLFLDLGSVLALLTRITEEVARTKACFLNEHMGEIRDALDSLMPAPDAAQFLGDFMGENFGQDWREVRFAVRSAGLTEDAQSRSFAGLYDSFLDIEAAALLSGIKAVWSSGFNQSALLERVAAGALGGGNPMHVIVQKMVPATHAGVAFSSDPLGETDHVVVETVLGIGQALVDGSSAGQHDVFLRDQIGQVDDLPNQCAALALKAEALLGDAVDIEWAYDGTTLWLLQLRPITTGRIGLRSTAPQLRFTDLYGDDETAFEEFAPLPEFARYFRAKRRVIAGFGKRHGLASATALVVRANRLGLQGDQGAALLARFESNQVVLDLNESLRQILLPRNEAQDQIISMMADPEEEHCFVLRDFIQGDIGLISEVQADHRVFVEWSPEGLMAVNRGTARTWHCMAAVDGTVAGEAPALSDDMFAALVLATRKAQTEIGPIRIEWTAGPAGLLAIDFSNVAASTADAQVPTAQDVVSHGYARAPLMRIKPDDALRRMSVAASVSLNSVPDADQMGDWFVDYMASAKAAGSPPIVVVDRPYAALAALIPHVSGFVFENASLLCHLAILLREKGRPAMQSPALYAVAMRSDTIAELDTRGTGLQVIAKQVAVGGI